MDDLLQDYFRSQMPKPWPAFKAPQPARVKSAPSLRSRFGARLALAASIALLIAGYWTLAGYFPGTPRTAGLEDVVPPIAQKDRGNANKKTPAPKVQHVPNDAAIR